jgi:hypothetical protein
VESVGGGAEAKAGGSDGGKNTERERERENVRIAREIRPGVVASHHLRENAEMKRKRKKMKKNGVPGFERIQISDVNF